MPVTMRGAAGAGSSLGGRPQFVEEVDVGQIRHPGPGHHLAQIIGRRKSPGSLQVAPPQQDDQLVRIIDAPKEMAACAAMRLSSRAMRVEYGFPLLERGDRVSDQQDYLALRGCRQGLAPFLSPPLPFDSVSRATAVPPRRRQDRARALTGTKPSLSTVADWGSTDRGPLTAPRRACPPGRASGDIRVRLTGGRCKFFSRP